MCGEKLEQERREGFLGQVEADDDGGGESLYLIKQ